MVALFINSVIGAGIFGLPSRVHELLGPYALLAYVACAFAVDLPWTEAIGGLLLVGRIMAISLDGSFRLCQACIPSMLKAGAGSIVAATACVQLSGLRRIPRPAPRPV